MFGGSRRRQPPAQPLTRETANPHAATAAAAVFMSRRDSNSSLSSAAAAAALRARPMTPTNVAEVQSKRANRRSPSLTSLTGSVRGRRELTRTPSMGSMTERTFRSPSPARSPAPRELDVPPVPAMPSVDQIMASQQTNGRTKGIRGPVLQTQPFRTASQKMKDGQPSWFGGATTRESGSPRHADAAIHSAAYVSEPRPGSVSPSINFSYPRSKALSPSPSLDDTLVYDPNSRRMIPKSELVDRSQTMREVSQKPKKKKQGTSKAGSHLSRGTVGGRTRAPALEQDQELEPQPEPQPAQQVEPQPEPAPAVAPEPTVYQPQDGAVKKKKKKKKKNKKPTVQPDLTREDLPAEEVVMAAKLPPLDTEPSVPVSGVVQEDAGQQEGPQKHISPAVAAVDATPAADVKPRATPETPDTTSQRPQVRQARVHSESPARSTHFASSSTDQLAVKHEPPARSVSPRKSAMKLSSQNRGVSPSDDGSEASGNRLLSPQEGEDPALARKKSVRVSWDDRNTVVVGEGVAPQETDSPMIPSPQTKKPWHNVVSKFTKKDNVNIAEDETMTPRPALPLFGSVREKKVRETEERPLVRPSERVFPAENGSAATGTGQSTDAVIGAAITQDLASRNAANISKYREPLPASQSSTVDDHSQLVDEESSDDDLDTDATTEPDEVPESITSKGSAAAIFEAPSTPTKQVTAQPEHNGNVPSISVSRPSPRAHGSGEATPPGGFPDDHSEPRKDSDDDYDESDSSGLSTPTRSAGPGVAAGPGMTDIVEEDEENENDRFSDAYEDLEEVDGDGFLSLDAVVDSPTSGMTSKKKAQDKSVAKKAKDGVEDEQEFFTPTKAPEPAPGSEDWENAKAYWKSLSVERRRQLEVEALSETGDESNAPKKEFSQESDGQLKKDPVPADVSNADRSYQIKPGTRWSEDEAVSDDERDSNLVQRASVLASRPKAVESAMPKLRTSMRQSMRADAQGASRDTGFDRPGSMRKSMRTGPGHAKAPSSRPSTTDGSNDRSALPAMSSTTSKVEMRQSMRSSRSNGDDLRPTLSASGRPSSYHHPATAGPMSSHKRNWSSDELNSSVPIKPTLRRRGSGDSESSFKRKRSGAGDGHNFRMSMRASMREAPSLNDPTTRFSLRSLSPPALRRNSFSSLPPGTPSSMGGGPGRMRQSLRDRPASSSSRLKMGSFKRSTGIGKKSKSGSRFADSSDEDEIDGPSLFRSRFADSSDEDEPVAVPKNKGLPKTLRNGKGLNFDGPGRDLDSPDLPGEDEGSLQPKRSPLVNGQSSLGRSRSGRGTLEPVPQNDMPKPTTRRGSFMSILRRKKDHSDKISKGFGESAARKDTNLERTSEELADLRNNSLKRGPSWPLPDEEGADTDAGAGAGVSRTKDPSRPSTSGGPSDSKKKTALLRRRSTSQGAVGLRHPEVDMTEPVPDIPDAFVFNESAQPPAPRKKKFGALRKMFGIHD